MRTSSRFYFLVLLSLLLCVFGHSVFGKAPVVATKLIDLDFKNADLKDVLRVLAAQEGANFLIDNEVSGSVTIHLTKLSFTDALNIISQTNNLIVNQQNNVYKITQVDNSVLAVDYKDGILSIEAKNAKLPSVFKNISEKTGLNLITAPDLKDRVTISLNRVTVDNAIETILAQTNCIADKRGSTTLISKRTTSQLPFKISYQNKLLTIDAQNIPLTSLTRAITENTGVSVVPSQDAVANISIYIQNLPLEEALDVLCDSNNLRLSRNGEAWILSRANPSQSQVNGQNLKINYNSKDQTFEIDVQMSPLSTIISEMARKADLNIVIGPEVNWTTNNVHLTKLTFNQSLDFLLKGTIFTYCVIDNTYMVGDGLMIRPENAHYSTAKLYPIKNLKADQLLNTLPPIFPRQNFVYIPEKNALVVTGPPSVHKLFADYLEQVDTENTEDRTEVIKIKYLKADDVLKYLPPSIPRNDIVVVKETNSITVSGPQNFIAQIKQYIEKIDQVNPMIMFDVMVVSVQDQNLLDWSTNKYIFSKAGTVIEPATGTISSGISNAGNLTQVNLKLLIEEKKAKILQNPTVSTLNGYPVSFSVSTKITRKFQTDSTTSTSGTTTTTNPVYSTKEFNSGIFITITPWVSANDQITMEIKPKFSEVLNTAQEFPDVTDRSTESTIRVSNKETVVISGLKSTDKSKVVNKIPILGDIPLIGNLFKTTTLIDNTTEYVVLITPFLVYNEQDKTEADIIIHSRFSTEINDGVNEKDPLKKDNMNK